MSETTIEDLTSSYDFIENLLKSIEESLDRVEKGLPPLSKKEVSFDSGDSTENRFPDYENQFFAPYHRAVCKDDKIKVCFPASSLNYKQIMETVGEFQDLVRNIRKLKLECVDKKDLTFVISYKTDPELPIVDSMGYDVLEMAGIYKFYSFVNLEDGCPVNTPVLFTPSYTLYALSEKISVEKKVKDFSQEIEKLRVKLNDSSFLNKAPEEVVAKARKRLELLELPQN